MSYDVAFDAFLTTTVQIAGLSTFDGYGAKSYSTSPSTYKARITQEPTLIRATDGQEVVSSHTCWIASTSPFSVTAKFTWSGSTYRMLRAGAVADEDGVHHMKVFLG